MQRKNFGKQKHSSEGELVEKAVMLLIFWGKLSIREVLRVIRGNKRILRKSKGSSRRQGQTGAETGTPSKGHGFIQLTRPGRTFKRNQAEPPKDTRVLFARE